MKWLGKEKFRLLRRQQGIGLIETVVALALLGLIGVAFLNGLTTTSRAVMISQEKVAAESLAKSQVEHIKSQAYISVFRYDPSDNATYYWKIDISDDLVSRGYDIEINAPEIVTAAGRAGFELQSITIKVKLYESVKLTTTFYRVGLAL